MNATYRIKKKMLEWFLDDPFIFMVCCFVFFAAMVVAVLMWMACVNELVGTTMDGIAKIRAAAPVSTPINKAREPKDWTFSVLGSKYPPHQHTANKWSNK